MFNLKTFNSIYKYITRSPFAGPPLRASITLSNKCNCAASAAVPGKEEIVTEMNWPRRKFFNAIDQLIDMGVRIFYFYGGECLIHPDFYKIVNYVSQEKGLFSEVVTNGTVLNEESVRKIIASGLSKIWISIDAPGETHDILRGVPGTFSACFWRVEIIMRGKNQKTIRKY